MDNVTNATTLSPGGGSSDVDDGSLDNYSPFQITMWFAMFSLGILFAYCFRTSIIRHMERSIHSERRTRVASVARRIPLDAEEARKNFLDETLMSYTWNIQNEVGNKLGAQNDDATTNGPQLPSGNLKEQEEADANNSSDADIASTKNHKYPNEKQMLGGAKECSICLAELCSGDQVSKSNNSSCSHIFHRECVYEWLIKHVECPMCRKDFLLPAFVVLLKSDIAAAREAEEQSDTAAVEQEEALENGDAGQEVAVGGEQELIMIH